MIRIGLVGLGRIGEVHARNIAAHPSATLAAVSDADSTKTAQAAERFGCETFVDLISMLEGSAIDAVVIASPTTFHVDHVILAASAGKAILCEKPLSLDLSSAERCGGFVESQNVPFMIALNKRFDPTISDLAGRVRQGEIGDVELVSLIGKDPEPPPESFILTSGGIFRDMMIHDIDLAVYLSGEFPTEIWAAGSVKVSDAFSRANDFDTAAAIMRTASGVLMTQTLSRRSTVGFDQRIEVHGSKGTLRSSNHHTSYVEILTERGLARPPLLGSFLDRYAASYSAELDYFVECLEVGRRIDLDVRHALRIQTIADGLTRAAHSAEHVRLS